MRKRVAGGLFDAKSSFETCAYQSPVRFRKPSDQADLPLRQRDGEQPEEGRLTKPRVPPIEQFAIGRSQFPRGLCRDRTNDRVGTIAMIELRGKYHGGPHLGRVGAGKRAGNDVAGFQTPSRSCCSNRFRDAAVASLKSSSDHESDHSTGRPPPSSANCCAQSSTFLASPGGSIRTTLSIFYGFSAVHDGSCGVW